jgi:hypothetical protein
VWYTSSILLGQRPDSIATYPERSDMTFLSPRRARVFLLSTLIAATCVNCVDSQVAQPAEAAQAPEMRTLTRDVYEDKVAGGWIGQAVGVLFGAPTEFLWPGEIIPHDFDGYYRLKPELYYEEAQPYIEAQQYQEMLDIMRRYKNDRENWEPYTPEQMPSQDDLYIEFLFLHSFQEYGLDVTDQQMAEAWVNYLDPNMIWGANKNAFENFQAEVWPPRSGNPDYSSLGNAIDFQIESDIFGLISPGLPQASNGLADRAGHLMNYGDGVYAGMAVAAMYGEAFFESDVRRLVEHSLTVIPPESGYAEMIHDVIAAHDTNPDDWEAAWEVIFDKWGQFLGLDVRTNGACVYLGLLYGEGDFWKTMNISMRCGLDSDCNPSTSAGIIGTILGMSNIPAPWNELRDLPISNASATRTRLTIEEIYPEVIQWDDIISATVEVGHQNIVANGGEITDTRISIPRQAPVVPALEQVAGEEPR